MGCDRRAARPLSPPPRTPQRRLVGRRRADRVALRSGHVESRDRRHRPGPPRRARLPGAARRLRPNPPPTRRRSRQDMEARSATARVDRESALTRLPAQLQAFSYGFAPGTPDAERLVHAWRTTRWATTGTPG